MRTPTSLASAPRASISRRSQPGEASTSIAAGELRLRVAADTVYNHRLHSLKLLGAQRFFVCRNQKGGSRNVT
jgi:hypothetical protein